MSEPKVESGLQLFARINESQHNNVLKYSPLLPNGIFPREYVEITGECGIGKTSVLLDFVVNSILPKTYHNINIPGNDIEVILINTDHHFNIGTIANLIEFKLKLYLKVNPTISIVEACLKKITLLNCYSSDQLKFTFLNLEYILQENKEIRLVAIDSICSYYWMDRIDLGFVSFNHYCSTIRTALTNIVNDFNIVTIYTTVQLATQSQEKYKKPADYCIYLKILTCGQFRAEVMKEGKVLGQIAYMHCPYLTFCT